MTLAEDNFDGSDIVKDTFNITSLIAGNSLQHLNKSLVFNYTSNYNFFKELGPKIFFEITPSKKVNIIQLNSANGIFFKTILVDSIDRLCDMSIRNDFNTFQPFVFQKKNLFGCYPLVKIAKYSFISQFDENFARFKLPNGKKGWLDINGKEFMD